MPSFAIWAIARCSWAPQSQRPEPKTSPVRHAEWTRTRTGSPSAHVPITSARCSSFVTSERNATARNSPYGVGRTGAAMRWTRRSFRIR